MKKINLNVPEELLAMLDDEADRQHMTRTAYILRSVQKNLEADAFLRANPTIQQKMLELSDALQNVAQLSDKDYAGLLGQQTLDL